MNKMPQQRQWTYACEWLRNVNLWNRCHRRFYIHGPGEKRKGFCCGAVDIHCLCRSQIVSTNFYTYKYIDLWCFTDCLTMFWTLGAEKYTSITSSPLEWAAASYIHTTPPVRRTIPFSENLCNRRTKYYEERPRYSFVYPHFFEFSSCSHHRVQNRE